jgi:hypothetical protein
LRVAWLVLAGFLLPALPAAAQLKFGEFSSKLNGTISSGYSADYGNQTSSDHSWTVGGDGNLSGSFYNPNFLTYGVSLFLNQSSANSNFQSISNASGINVTSNIFGGSHFPGSIGYSKAYNSQGNYAIPGIANFVTHGNNDTFGINWSENIPEMPSLSVGFQRGGSTYTVYGANDDGNNSFHSLNLHSSYSVAGFNFGGYYTRGASTSLIPEVIAGEDTTETHSTNNTFGFTFSHLLPLRGAFSGSVNRSNWDSDYLGTSSSGTVDTVNASATVHPTEKLLLMTSLNYSDNLSGQLYQSVVAAGGVIPGIDSNSESDSLDVLGIATYNLGPSIQSSAFVEERAQTFLGKDYSVQSYGGSLTFGHKVLGGILNGAMTITDNNSNENSSNALGISATTNYATEVRGWHVAGAFGYAQNVQTLLITYTNSFYNYSGNVRRRWGRFNASFGAGGAHTALTQQTGTANSSESYNASLSYTPWIVATGAYTKSSGQALATGSGLVPVPVPSPILPSNLVSLFGGNSYTFGLSSSPVKKLTLSAAYSKSDSNTSSNGVASTNQNTQYNALVQYQMRKITVNSGYARLQQGFSESGTPPEVVSSFYIGVSRWFNFF